MQVPSDEVRKCNSKKSSFKIECRMKKKWGIIIPAAGINPKGVSFEVFLGLPSEHVNILAGTVQEGTGCSPCHATAEYFEQEQKAFWLCRRALAQWSPGPWPGLLSAARTQIIPAVLHGNYTVTYSMATCSRQSPVLTKNIKTSLKFLAQFCLTFTYRTTFSRQAFFVSLLGGLWLLCNFKNKHYLSFS